MLNVEHAGAARKPVPQDNYSTLRLAYALRAFLESAADLSQPSELKPAFAAEAAREYQPIAVGNPRGPRNREAPEVTIDAVMWDLRERGAEALEAASCQQRLRELSPEQ
jgi:hypothetical protein